MDEDYLIICFVGMAVTALGVYCLCRGRALKKIINAEFRCNPFFAEPNDDGKDVSLFMLRFIGMFGTCFFGKFREAMIGERNSYVAYHCTCFLFFIFPGTCYRVIPLYGGTSYNIIGSEQSDKREITSLKLQFYGTIALILGIAAIIMGILFTFS